MRFRTRHGRAAGVAVAASAALVLAGLLPGSAGAAPDPGAAAGPGAAGATVAPDATGAGAAAAGDWLHADGNRIVDADGNPVWLTGANWFGFNATERVFHGLWSANMRDVTASMAERGINIVRVPISTQLLLEWRSGQAAVPSGVNTYANPELDGLTTLEVFDAFLALAEEYGLKVMLDVHSAEADNAGHFAPMWYTENISSEDFYLAWEWVAERYRTNDTLVAMDIENEPHGTQAQSPRAKWDGSTDQDNWKHACETAGERVLAINPNVLILCEGIEIYPRDGAGWDSTDEDDYHFNWWGGNLRGVRDHPVQLGAHQDQLVYSPHDYGPLVHQQPWFEGEWDRTTLERDVWDPNWLYLHKENTAPLLVGEWGGFLDGGPNEKWMTALRDMMTEYGVHHTFWCLNPNSGDTGGLLLHDWATWDEEKYALLKPALWQEGGKFVGLDHEVPLGGPGSTTGISLDELYGGGPPEDDEQPPTAPGTPTAVPGDTSVELSWPAATDNDRVSGYTVVRVDGQTETEAATASGTSATVTGLEPETEYTFAVYARDPSGNLSPRSAAVTVTTNPDGQPPLGDCTAGYQVANAWDGGFQASVTLTNTGGTAVRDWAAGWTFAGGQEISNLWGGTAAQSGAEVTVTHPDWSPDLAPGASVEIGFTATGGAAPPGGFTLNGMTCAAG